MLGWRKVFSVLFVPAHCYSVSDGCLDWPWYRQSCRAVPHVELIDRLCMCMNVWPCTGGRINIKCWLIGCVCVWMCGPAQGGGLILNVELIDRLCMCMNVWPCTGGRINIKCWLIGCVCVWMCGPAQGGGLILNVELIDRLCMCMNVWPCTGGGGGGGGED